MTRFSGNWMWLVVLVSGSFRITLSQTNCEQLNKKCTIITNCTSALEALKARESQLLRNMFCGFDVRGPKVCCPVDRAVVVFTNDTETATSRIRTTSTTIHPTTPLTTSTTVTIEDNTILNPEHTAKGLPSTDICGISGSGSDRIIGGSITALDEFPWLARISTLKRDTARFTCGGSLITQQFVVTAAHCVTDKTVSGVRLGEWDTQTDLDCADDYCSDPPLDLKVVKVIVYPTYDKTLFNGDIALLKMERPVNFSDFIRPICLPTKLVADQDYVPGTTFTTAGWGHNELGMVSVIKQKVDLDTVPLEICKQKMAHVNKMDSNKIICAGGKPGKDTCNGDSGGPLSKDITIKFKTNAYLFGITSFGSVRCGVTDTPSVYTRVVAYMDWIIANIDA